jgi:RNA polymerase sigma factor (sigma-70 family)
MARDDEAHVIDVLTLDELLHQLAALNPRHAKVVELRFFGGMGIEETAEVLSVSPATVKNDWRAARAWLLSRLESGESEKS